MQIEDRARLTDAELHELLDRLFPHGLVGADVAAELAPEGWERSTLVACFHPSVERVFEETLRIHRNLAHLVDMGRRRAGASAPARATEPEPTLESVRESYQPTPVKPEDELAELMGMCLWDVLADNHEVIAADGRLADLGSFRGASAFLDEYLTQDGHDWREGDYMRFYMGTFAVSERADLAPVYAMIFRRLRTDGADWIYHFPELLLVELGSAHAGDEDAPPARYSPNEALAAERESRDRNARIAELRADMAESNARARELAMDQPPPAIIRAYREVYGRDPRGWPPA